MPPRSTENMATSVLLVGQTRKFSDDEIKPLLNEEQWRQFQIRLQDARNFELFLLRRGEWPIRKLVDDASERTDLNKE